MREMKWIPVFTDFPRHPKTIHLREMLGVSTADIYPIRLWIWAAEFYENGILPVSGATIERALEWEGEDGRLVKILLEAQYIEQMEDGGYAIVNWDRKTGFHIQKMRSLLDRDRSRKRTIKESNGHEESWAEREAAKERGEK